MNSEGAKDFCLFFYLFIIGMILVDAGMSAYALQNGFYETNRFTNAFGMKAYLTAQFLIWTGIFGMSRFTLSRFLLSLMIIASAVLLVNNIWSVILLL